MKKKFVTLGIMMALSMTVAAGCGQKQEMKQQPRKRLRVRRQIPQPQTPQRRTQQPQIQQERMGQEVRQRRQHSQMAVISMYPQRRLWRRQR